MAGIAHPDLCHPSGNKGWSDACLSVADGTICDAEDLLATRIAYIFSFNME